jgi:hypothetical protein
MKTAAIGPRAFPAPDQPSDSIERALQICPILVGHAMRRETTTYMALARDLGYEHDRGFTFMGGLLFPLVAWCKQRGLPLLPALVVNAHDGYAKAEGLYGDAEGCARETAAIYAERRWHRYYAPTADELDAALAWWHSEHA